MRVRAPSSPLDQLRKTSRPVFGEELRRNADAVHMADVMISDG
jgi:hypothetical protein